MLPEARVAEPVTEAEAVRLAREIYGIEVSARTLPSEYDDNFHLSAADGGVFVLKVMCAAREREFIEMQCSALAHLAQHAPKLSLPRVCPTRSREHFIKTILADRTERFVWMLSYLPGAVLAEVRPHTAEMFESLGRILGEMDSALQGFSHPYARRELKWDLSRAGWIREHLDHIAHPSRRALVEKSLRLYDSEVVPALPQLRRSVIYGDANDYNVIVGDARKQPREIAGVIDFGDMHYGPTVSEAAVAAAYAIFGKKNPLEAAHAIVRGYHRAFPLNETEIAALFPLIGMRLAVSVVNSARRKTLRPDDPYVTISEAPAWEALERLAGIHPRFANYTLRAACGLEAVPHGKQLKDWLKNKSETASSILDVDVRTEPCRVFDLSVGSAFLGANPKSAETAALTEKIFDEMRRTRVSVGVGRYDEARLLYTSPLFGAGENPTDERRTIHLGIDLFAQPGASLHAPLEGVVHVLANNTAALDYGPLVILRHSTGDGLEFFTLYGHLAKQTLEHLKVGQRIAQGESFAWVGKPDENGGWTPHVHFQIILDLLERDKDFPGVAPASERAVWTSLSLDPNLLLGIPAERFPKKEADAAETFAARRAILGKNLSVSYHLPLKIVRGWMQYLYDETGRAYLDVYNNVPLVGHSHPRVVRAAQLQLALLNTNTRYLHDTVVRYAERLTQRLPEPLRVCYFLNSGSEANELALRLARTHTGREDIIVLEHAYHGHTSALIDISPYKFNGPGGRGRKPWVHVAPIADDYRGLYRRDDPEAGAKYARHIAEILKRLQRDGGGVAAFIAETLPSVAGQIVFPHGYLEEAYRHVRAAGGVCIADEVQVGFGRLGTHFWGFETQGVVPDIVVMGKPIGNGFPLAAVITTAKIAASFDNGMEFFSTFGGNPVAAAAGLAVLDVLDEEQLQVNALRVGNHFIGRLKELQERHALIGDVRGSGLFLGVDFVRDRATREPAAEEADYVVNRLRDCGVLTGTDGPHHNVIKLRPPLIFSQQDVELFVTALDSILGEDAAQPQS
ncbi:MAG TPA: aminotransferase class III-fold pyridoxal phosphate-dependent enzyme [Candidatus Acidoferrales bacterium]|nr:aminotransferase class III-fold pyridoxal phosphate-dependent enzyme [Candidatus Acidoferrales bacterium]